MLHRNVFLFKHHVLPKGISPEIKRRWTVELSRSNQSHTPKVPLELFQVILQTDPAYAILNIKDFRFEKVLLTKVFKENSPSFLDGFTISTSMVLE